MQLSISNNLASRFVLVASASLMLSACGGGGGDGSGNGNRVINFPGLAVFGVGNEEEPDQIAVPWLAVINTFRIDSEPASGRAPFRMKLTGGLVNLNLARATSVMMTPAVDLTAHRPMSAQVHPLLSTPLPVHG